MADIKIEAKKQKGPKYDVNTVTVTGRVESSNIGKTKSQSACCSYIVQVKSSKFMKEGDDGKNVIFVRVNVFDELAKRAIESNVRRGVYVLVCGELMERKMRDGKFFIEIRAKNFIWVSPDISEYEDQELVLGKKGV